MTVNDFDTIGFLEDSDDDELIYNSQSRNQKFEHYRFIADKGQSLLRIDKFLTSRIEGATRSRIQQAADSGSVMVNGKPVKSNYKVKPADLITIMLDWPKRDPEIIPENIPLDIIYEDDDLMVVNKPSGMVVHPGHGNYSGTLVNALAYYLNYDDLKDMGDPRLGLVHRIDKETSGLLLVAKTDEAKKNLSAQFFRQETQRLYITLVWGDLTDESGRIEGNIGRDPRDRTLMRLFPDNSEGKTAITHWRVLERFEFVTLVECKLETGRTHQIRVHVKHLGHTVFNDKRYGGDQMLRGTNSAKQRQFVNNCFNICPRQCLHAHTLAFVHPTTGEKLSLKSEIPKDMQSVIDKWRIFTAMRIE